MYGYLSVLIYTKILNLNQQIEDHRIVYPRLIKSLTTTTQNLPEKTRQIQLHDKFSIGNTWPPYTSLECKQTPDHVNSDLVLDLKNDLVSPNDRCQVVPIDLV